MAAEEATTPRGVRHRGRSMGVTSVQGSITHKSLADDSNEDELMKHSQTVKDLLQRTTQGKVTVQKGTAITQLRCEFILSLNSLDYEEAIRAAVRELSVPWEIERTEHRGLRKNPHSLDIEGLEAGFATLIIVRRGLYVPKTGTCRLVIVGLLIAAGWALLYTTVKWLWTL